MRIGIRISPENQEEVPELPNLPDLAAEKRAREQQAAVDALPFLCDALSQKLEFFDRLYHAGPLPVSLEEILYQIRQAIAESYVRAFLLGKRAAGSLYGVTEDEQTQIEELCEKAIQKIDESIVAGMSISSNSLPGPAFWAGFASAQPAHALIRWCSISDEESPVCESMMDGNPYTPAQFRERAVEIGMLPGMHPECQCYLLSDADKKVRRPRRKTVPDDF